MDKSAQFSYKQCTDQTVYVFGQKSEKKDPSFPNEAHEKTSRISYLERDRVRSKINFLVCPQEPLLATVKRRKLAWFRRVTRHDCLSKTILQGILKGGRRRGRQMKCWIDTIKEWTYLPMPELLTRASCRKNWKRISAGLSLKSPRRPNRSRD